LIVKWGLDLISGLPSTKCHALISPQKRRLSQASSGLFSASTVLPQDVPGEDVFDCIVSSAPVHYSTIYGTHQADSNAGKVSIVFRDK